MGLVALGLTLVAPAIVDLATPSATTVDTATGSAPSTPTSATDPLAPPSLLATR